MAKSVYYAIPPHFDVMALAVSIAHFLEHKEKLETQILNYGMQLVVQAREDRTWKKAMAMDKAAMVRITYMGAGLSIQVGAGKWLDKAVGLGVGAVFWPALLPVAIGIVGQRQLPERILWHVQSYMHELCSGYPPMPTAPPPPPPETVHLPEAAPPSPKAAGHFCTCCGAALKKRARRCPYCGAAADI